MRRSSSSDSKTTCGCLIVVAVVIAIIVAVNSGKSSTSSKSGVQLQGADPKAFQTAQDLYSFPEKQALSNSETNSLLNDLKAYVNAGTYPEDTNFRSVLLRLDGAPDKTAIVTAIEQAAPVYYANGNFSSSSTTQGNASFNSGNTSYEAGKFDTAVTSYTQALVLSPGHLDARNNLGLAEMHLGNNVAALLHFNIILGARSNYLGAEQNTAVALERMGLSSQAQEHARHVASQDSSLPMAHYNLGWFASLNQDYSGAEKSFASAVKLYPNYTKAKHASTVNKIASGAKLTKTDLSTLPKAEQSAYSSIGKPAAPTPVKVSKPAANDTKTAAVKPKSVTTVWWWVLMVASWIVLFILMGVAATKEKAGATVWGLFSLVGIIITVIVFAIFFRSSSTFSIVLWSFVGLDIIIMAFASK
jgi:tetratricopeptide (TPR) repeat protein